MLKLSRLWFEKPPHVTLAFCETFNGDIRVYSQRDAGFEICNYRSDGERRFLIDMDAVKSIYNLNPNKLPKLTKERHIMNNLHHYPSFRDIYESCFTNGVATSESTSIHIARAITTLCKDAYKYNYMHILVVSEDADETGYQDNISVLCKKWFPYGFFSHHLFVGFSTPETPDSIPDVVIDVNGRLSSETTTMLMIKYIHNETTDGFLAELKQLEYKPPVFITQIKMLSDSGECTSKKVAFDPQSNYEAHIEFYPFLKPLYPQAEELSIEYIVKDFMHSKANLLLLIGPAGTAKSTLIRSFIRKEHEVLVVSSAQVLESSALPTTFRTSPKDDSKKMVTIYEDADIFVAPREKGNLALSSMLNQLDGVVGSKEKFIISTNLESISKVDRALLRPGRCHKVMQFRLLQGEEINAARAAIGKPPIDETKPLTLSEALHYNEIEIEDRKTATFGFAP